MRSSSRACAASVRGNPFALAPLVAALCAATSNVEGATIGVNDASDGPVLGKCSLSDAVTALNTMSAVNGCAAGDGNSDTIDLSFFTGPTSIAFELPSPDGKSALAFARPATLHGPTGSDGKALVTIRRSATAATNFRVIETAADLTIENLDILGGVVSGRGGGIDASGYANLTVSNSTVSGNTTLGASYSGGGVSVEHGNITLDRCTLTNNNSAKNGGGAYAAFSGTITLSRSSVSGNTAMDGGGVYNFLGTVVLDAATVSANAASVAYGVGGIYAYHLVRLTNSTVTGNSGAGVFSFGSHSIDRRAARPLAGTNEGNVQMRFSTVSGNAVGIVAGASATFDGSIVKGNSTQDLQIFINTAVATTINQSIIGGRPPFLDCDPMLAPLADNGGPTQTMALQPGSCAIDAGGTPYGLASDQRGAKFARSVGAAADIGAFELQPAGERIFYDGFGS